MWAVPFPKCLHRPGALKAILASVSQFKQRPCVICCTVGPMGYMGEWESGLRRRVLGDLALSGLWNDGIACAKALGLVHT